MHCARSGLCVGADGEVGDLIAVEIGAYAERAAEAAVRLAGAEHKVFEPDGGGAPVQVLAEVTGDAAGGRERIADYQIREPVAVDVAEATA